LTAGERLTTPLIRQEGGLVPATWEQALQAAFKGLSAAGSLAGILSGRNTNEEAFLFAKLMKKVRADAALEVVYRERELTETQKILMSPDRSPNFRGVRDVGVSSPGGFDALMSRLVAGDVHAAYIVGENLLADGDAAAVSQALQKLSFLVVQDTRITETAKLAHVVLPSTHFGEKDGTYTNRKGRVQKLNAAVIPPAGARQDSEIFLRLLDLAGERLAAETPAEIFEVLAGEVSSYQGLNHGVIGALGAPLGGGAAEPA
jgi:predicted molibdopterin-dependent oxidoreductase YjgC